jgi:hypothetical protein
LKDIAAMATLEDEEIKTIVRDVAAKNHVPVEKEDITTALAIDSDGLDAIDIVISLAPSISSRLADAGEERLPIVWFSEKHAS